MSKIPSISSAKVQPVLSASPDQVGARKELNVFEPRICIAVYQSIRHQARQFGRALLITLGTLVITFSYLCGQRQVEIAYFNASSLEFVRAGTESKLYIETFKGWDFVFYASLHFISVVAVPWLVNKSCKPSIVGTFFNLGLLVGISYLVFNLTGNIGKHGYWISTISYMLGNSINALLFFHKSKKKRKLTLRRGLKLVSRVSIMCFAASSSAFCASLYILFTQLARGWVEFVLLGVVLPLIQWLSRVFLQKAFLITFLRKSSEATKSQGMGNLSLLTEVYLITPAFVGLFSSTSEFTFYAGIIMALGIECVEVILYIKGSRLLKITDELIAIKLAHQELGEKVGIFVSFLITLSFSKDVPYLLIGRFVFAVCAEMAVDIIKVNLARVQEIYIEIVPMRFPYYIYLQHMLTGTLGFCVCMYGQIWLRYWMIFE